MSEALQLIAYETVPSKDFELVTAPHGRDWMDSTHDRSAYRCLPLLMANQAGWMILNPARVRIKWDGGAGLGAVEIQRWEMPGAQVGPDYLWPISHFGQGIITWTLPFLFRTPTGYNLLVRGPANSVKDGVAPLEGLVETDWTPATFTMNWKITRPNIWIDFEKGEPICMIVPQCRGELEKFAPEILAIEDDPELQASNASWCESRDRFNAERKESGSEAARRGLEGHYLRGASPDGLAASEHQTRLRLREFTR